MRVWLVMMLVATTTAPEAQQSLQKRSSPRPSFRVTTDTIFNEFRDREPRIYHRLSRMLISDIVYFRVSRRQCDPQGFMYLSLEVDLDRYGSARERAEMARAWAGGSMNTTIYYSLRLAGGNEPGSLGIPQPSTLITDRATGKRFGRVLYEVSEEDVRRILLNPATTLLIFDGLRLRLTDQNRRGLSSFFEIADARSAGKC